MIIDCHSHIGHDWMMEATSIKAYDKLLKDNAIFAGIVMPEPGHINEQSGKRLLLWNFEGNSIHHYSPHYNTDDISVLKMTSKIINDEIYGIITSFTDRHCKLYFAPMIHPIVDDVKYYDTLLADYNCVALKMHGIAGGYSPEMIDNEHIEAIRQTGLPIIIHTDFDRNIQSELGRIRNMNTSRRWFDFLKNNRLKGYLCHGCRMDLSVLSDVASSTNILVGIGPDWAIQKDINRLPSLENMDYLHTLVKYLPKEKLAFDIDYNYLEGDNEFVKRIKSNLPKEYYDNVMYKNAISFFGLDI